MLAKMILMKYNEVDCKEAREDIEAEMAKVGANNMLESILRKDRE